MRYMNYALAPTAALSLGLLFAFWHLASENNRLRTANLTVEIALEAMRDEAKSLREKVAQEARERRRAELSQARAENAERAANDRIMREVEARDAARNAKAAAEAKLEASGLKLGELQEARLSAERARDDAQAALAAERNEYRRTEAARNEAVAAATLINAKLAEEIRIIRSAEAALDTAHEEMRTLASIASGNDPKLCRVTPEMVSEAVEGRSWGEGKPLGARGPRAPKEPAATASPQPGVLFSAGKAARADLSIQ